MTDKQTDNQPALQPPELLPCPFCGAAPKLIAIPIEVHYYVMCIECGACGSDLHGREDAITAWNTRARVVDGVVATVDAERQAAAIVTIWRAVKDHDDKLLVRYIKQALLEWCPVAPTAPIAAPVENLNQND